MKKKSIPEALRSLRGPRASRSRSSGPGCQPTPRNALRCFSESRCHLSREACHSWWNSRCCGDTSQPRSFSLSTMRSWARGSDALPQRNENPRSATAANAPGAVCVRSEFRRPRSHSLPRPRRTPPSNRESVPRNRSPGPPNASGCLQNWLRASRQAHESAAAPPRGDVQEYPGSQSGRVPWVPRPAPVASPRGSPGSSASPPTRRRSHRPRRRSPSRMPSVAARSSEASSGVCGSSSRVR